MDKQGGEQPKAFLVSKAVGFPKTHDLLALNHLCSAVLPAFTEIEEAALRLPDFAVAIRYPDAPDDLTIEAARKALNDAVLIKNFVLQHIL